MKYDELLSEIEDIIFSKYEDDFCDFKQVHHDNTASLLHDIICMANNRTNRDGYIIFGIEDKTCNILGVEGDPNRRTQADIVGQLKNKKFFADIRPRIAMHTIAMDGHEIDVLIVKNTLNTPYYLVDSHRDRNKEVKAHHIYTRVCDTNTDIDKSAAPNHVEYLWKKRFGLHLMPYERLKLKIADKDAWKFGSDVYHHTQSPEFTILIENDYEDGVSHPEFYAYLMTNTSVGYGRVYAKYFGTTLAACQFVSLDGGRLMTIAPDWGHIVTGPYRFKPIPFKYYLRDSMEWALHLFLFREDSDSANIARDEFLSVILLFDSEREKDEFSDYVGRNEARLVELTGSIGDRYDHVQPTIPHEKESIILGIKHGIALKQMLKEWRSPMP